MALPLTPAQLAGLAITAADFDEAVKKVQPSVRREGFATTPDVTWNDIGALSDVGPLCLSPAFHMSCSLGAHGFMQQQAGRERIDDSQHQSCQPARVQLMQIAPC